MQCINEILFGQKPVASEDRLQGANDEIYTGKQQMSFWKSYILSIADIFMSKHPVAPNSDISSVFIYGLSQVEIIHILL